MKWFGYEATKPEVELDAYAPFYLAERRRALRRSLRQMKRRLGRLVGAK
jgi:hypothetical protein